MGWTEPDLRLVVNHLKRLIRLERRRPESLKFHNLIGNVDGFNEDLADARAESRVKKPTPRQQMLASVGRCEQMTSTARTAAEIMAGNRAFQNFKLWRGETGL